MASVHWQGIHPQAIVDPGAKLASSVTVGPWSYIGPGVEIDEDTVIESHVVIKGPTRIGKRNRIFQFATVGEDCQDKKYKGEETRLVIGDDNIIRENCTIHRGTIQDNAETRIGNNNLLMAYAHVAHDCVIGDYTILANAANVAGHVHIGDYAILGGGSLVHQFCKIGPHSMSAGGSIVLKDVPAYVMASGQSAQPFGINSEGLKRRGFSSQNLTFLKRAYKAIYRQGLTTEQAIVELEKMLVDEPLIEPLLDSLKNSQRGIIR